MLKKIRSWFNHRRKSAQPGQLTGAVPTPGELSILLENAYKVGYTDGRRDGLAIAREQATKSLSEILKKQNER